MKDGILRVFLWSAVNVGRLLLSGVFIFSGIVKTVDPRGTQYKFEEYIVSFGVGDWVPGFVPLWAAVALAVFEFSLGIYMLFGIRRRLTCWLMMLFLCVMSVLTLYIAVEEPVSDCGCFGDAVYLTGWETFWKNVALLVLVVFVWLNRRRMTRFVTERNQWTISLYSIVFAFVLAEFCIYDLPVLDFRPYRIGVDLRAEKEKSVTESIGFRTTVIYEREGLEREFELEELPEDTTWHFVGRKSVALGNSGGVVLSNVDDFSISLWPDGEDITDDVLGFGGYTFLLISSHLEAADDGNIDRINELYDYCQAYGCGMYCLTASGTETIERWQELTGADYCFGWVDETVLKTMVRSNPGLLLLKNGVIYNKWSCNGLPKEEDLRLAPGETELGVQQTDSRAMKTTRVFLWYIIPLLLFILADRIWFGSKFFKKIRENRKNKLFKSKENEKENCGRQLENES